MKTIKDYTSFVNENIKESFIDVELDQDVIDYYLEVIGKGLSKEEAIEQVAADFGISDEAVGIIVDEAGVKESVEIEEEEEEVIEESKDDMKDDETKKIEKDQEGLDGEMETLEESVETEELNEASDEDEYLTTKQKKLPDALKKGIIAKMKKAGKKVGDKKEDDDKKDDKKDDSSKSDEDKYLTAKQKKLPEGLKKAIIKKAKAKK